MAHESGRGVLKLIGYCWAAPTTLIGAVCGTLTLLSGGRVQCVDGVLEFYGGFARWVLQRTPVGARAMTLGHIVLGVDPRCLHRTRAHERAHVAQTERWGILFLPAYGLASLWAWLRGGHYYRDNWFERDAIAKAAGPNAATMPFEK